MAKRIKKETKKEVTETVVPNAVRENVLGEKNEGRTTTERDALVDKNEYKWDKHVVESPHSAPINDPMAGKERLIRRFVICTPPESPATKEEVLDFNKRSMLEHLFQTGWEPIKEPLVDVLTVRQAKQDPSLTLPSFAKDMHIFAIYWTCEIGYGRHRYAETPTSNATDALRNATKRSDNK